MTCLLIVDDNAKMRRMMRSLVEDLASAVYECSNGREALAAYDAHQPDFVLMDIAMAEVDGITATRQIREAHPAAQIIIVTNYDEVSLREAAQSAGACGYVVKDNLLDVRRLLQTSLVKAPTHGRGRPPAAGGCGP